MKGIQFITDEKNQRKAVVIELSTIEKHPSEVEDFLDTLVAEARKAEPKLDWEKVKTNLKKKGKI